MLFFSACTDHKRLAWYPQSWAWGAPRREQNRLFRESGQALCHHDQLPVDLHIMSLLLLFRTVKVTLSIIRDQRLFFLPVIQPVSAVQLSSCSSCPLTDSTCQLFPGKEPCLKYCFALLLAINSFHFPPLHSEVSHWIQTYQPWLAQHYITQKMDQDGKCKNLGRIIIYDYFPDWCMPPTVASTPKPGFPFIFGTAFSL